MSDNNARIILALAAEADDKLMWDRLTDIQAGMFAVGPVEINPAGHLAWSNPMI